MYLLRRAAVRGLQSKPFAAQSSRTFISSTTFAPRTHAQLSQQWPQRRLYSDKTNESPAERQSGETVTTEPSPETQKQEIVEESVATPDVADAAQTASTESSGNPMGMEPGDAAPAPEATPSKPQHDSAAETASSTAGSVKDQVRSATETVSQVASSAAASATGAARSVGRGRSDRHDSQPSKILYVGNLFFDLTPERLKAVFSPYGNVVNCKIVTDSSGLSKGFGYIEFDDLEASAKAVAELDQQEVEGRRMAVQYHVRRMRTTDRKQSQNPPSKTLFIGNMSFQMSDKDLNDLFRQIKNVLDVRVAIDRRSGQPRGFAHADFTDTASAEKAKTILENKVVYGRQLRVDFGLPSAMSRQK